MGASEASSFQPDTVSERLLLIVAEAIGTSRIATLMGDEFRVVPAVLVQSQVLNNNLGATFLPAEEITAEWAEEWNGAPVVVHEHPTKRGVAVSAKDPEVLNSLGVGFVFNAKVDEVEGVRRLKAEVWLKLARAQQVAELQEILDRLDQGNPVELSTGFPTFIEDVTGVHNGLAFNMVLRPRGVDHLAIFAESIGACSVDDGCGLGVNKKEEDKNSEEGGSMDPVTTAAAPPAVATQEAEGGAAPQELSAFNRFLSFFGFRRAAQNAESDEDRRQLLLDALRNTFGGLGKWLWIEAVFSEDGYLVFDVENENPGGESGLFRADFTIDAENKVTFADPVPVRRRTVFEPVANEQAADTGNRGEQGENMNRENMIAALASAGPLPRVELEKLNDCALKALHDAQATAATGEGAGGSGTAGNAAGAPAPAAAPATAAAPAPAAQADTTPAPAVGDAALKALTDSINSLRQEVSGLKTQVEQQQEVLRPAAEERAQQRTELVQELSGNNRVLAVYSKESLEAMGFDELNRVRSLVRGESYAGRGGPRTTVGNREPQYAEPIPYYDTKAAGSATAAAGQEA